MKNKWIYFWTIMLSLVLVSLPLISDIKLNAILSGIGCSALAAAIMAIFLEKSEIRGEERKKQLSRSIYLQGLNSQITMLIERIIWFDKRVEDQSFNWDYNESVYSTLQFMIQTGLKYKESNISFQEAITTLGELRKKYSSEQMANKTQQEKEKIQKMFSIIAVGSKAMLTVVEDIKKDKLLLENAEYLSINDNDGIHMEVGLIFSCMLKKLDSYEVPISSLIRLSKKVRELGCFTNEIRIGLHGSISITEA